MIRLRRGCHVFWVNGLGEVVPLQCCRRYGDQWFVERLDLGAPTFLNFLCLFRRELFVSALDAENHARAVRAALVEDGDMIDLGDYSNG